jgi:hypothetical protein
MGGVMDISGPYCRLLFDVCNNIWGEEMKAAARRYDFYALRRAHIAAEILSLDPDLAWLSAVTSDWAHYGGAMGERLLEDWKCAAHRARLPRVELFLTVYSQEQLAEQDVITGRYAYDAWPDLPPHELERLEACLRDEGDGA